MLTPFLRNHEDLSEPAVRARYGRYSAGVRSALSALDHEAVNYSLAAQVVGHFLRQPAPLGPRGQPLSAILVFLAGAKEIQRMRSVLYASVPELAQEPHCSWVLTLHSSLPPEEQRQAFERPPAGVRKVVLSTNIAETSITIDDVGVVVDSGHVKETRYDSDRGLTSLEDVFVSRASAQQRRGRAGRVAPGTCVHLVTRHRHDQLLQPRQEAEVQRVPLEQLVLRIHAARMHLHEGAGSAAEVCARLIEPPAPGAVRRSVQELVDLGALSEAGERLTPLGLRLVELPLDARVGKLAVLATAFGPAVLESALVVAAALTVGSPLACPHERSFQARLSHRSMADDVATGGLSCSDLLAAWQA